MTDASDDDVPVRFLYPRSRCSTLVLRSSSFGLPSLFAFFALVWISRNLAVEEGVVGLDDIA